MQVTKKLSLAKIVQKKYILVVLQKFTMSHLENLYILILSVKGILQM